MYLNKTQIGHHCLDFSNDLRFSTSIKGFQFYIEDGFLFWFFLFIVKSAHRDMLDED